MTKSSLTYIAEYFPNLTDIQRKQFETMLTLYPEWNAKINVISRKDIDNLEVNHILHSLAIAKFIKFKPNSIIIDLGCGGGLPGLPLAVLFPECQFVLIDRTAKKLHVADEIASASGITNITTFHGDAAEYPKRTADFVVSRAVMPLPDLVKLSRPLVRQGGDNALPNGLITLKGGNIEAEIYPFRKLSIIEPVSNWFKEDFFETKLLTYTQL